MIQVNDIVQVTNPDNAWYPSLVVVSEIKSFGIQGYTHIPLQGDAFIRLNTDDYERVGQALIVHEEASDGTSDE